MAISLLLVMLISLFCSGSATADDCFRVTAAVTYDDDQVYLISGDQFIKFDSSLKEVKSGNMTDEYGGPPGKVDAALIFSVDEVLYFFVGDNHYHYSAFWGSTGEAIENSEIGQFFVGGIDAAGTVGGESYFFSGCDFIRSSKESDEMSDVDDLNLPCDIEAALGHGLHLYAIKGDNVWIRNSTGAVVGPEKLSSIFTVTSTSFCHEKGDPHTTKVRAEQEYEGEHGCVIVDAAITWDDVVYLFNDDSYVTLDGEGQENGGGSNLAWGGLKGNVDAGVVWSGNEKTYFFRGSGYFNYYLGHSFGPFKNSLWAPFFEAGIDAAANHNGSSYFFKGCEIARYQGPEYEVTATFTNEDLNLPCDVHAAFTRAGIMYVIKYDKVWTWNSDSQTATGPENLFTVADLTTWEACPEEESNESS